MRCKHIGHSLSIDACVLSSCIFHRSRSAPAKKRAAVCAPVSCGGCARLQPAYSRCSSSGHSCRCARLPSLASRWSRRRGRAFRVQLTLSRRDGDGDPQRSQFDEKQERSNRTRLRLEVRDLLTQSISHRRRKMFRSEGGGVLSGQIS